MANGDSSFFSAEQVRQHLGFPRYRIYCYNTINKAVEANVYINLTN